MKKIVAFAISLLLSSHGVFAGEAQGSGALVLAALTGENSPLLNAVEKKLLAKLLNGNLVFVFPANKKIEIIADAVTCRSSNVDISAHSCELNFGAKKVLLQGRKAHELYATLAEAGVASGGAAGSIFEALAHLACSIEPSVIKQKNGGGADCKYESTP
jgi:hypothetical protein